MTNAERMKKLESMPADYKPQKPLDFMAVHFEHAEGIKALPRDQAGEVFVRLFDYAMEFATTFDDDLKVNTSGLDAMAAYIAKQLAGGIKRAAQSAKEASFLRSGNNNGGRPRKG